MKAQRIVAADIREYHPEGLVCSTDIEYANLANRLMKTLSKSPYVKEFCDEIGPDFLRRLSILLTLHAEDVISNLGIWRSFCLRHNLLYGKYMPFGLEVSTRPDKKFSVDTYTENSFLLLAWQLANDESEDSVFGIVNPCLRMIGLETQLFFLPLLEDAPINDDLLDFIYGEETLSDIVEVRKVLSWLSRECYMMQCYQADCDFGLHFNSLETFFKDHPNMQEYAAKVTFPFFKKSGLLALLPKDWYCTMLATWEEDRTKQALEVGEMEFQKFNVFRVESYDDKVLRVQSVEGQHFEVVRSSFLGDISQTLAECDTVLSAFVHYRGVWETVGGSSWYRKGGDVFDKTVSQMAKHKEQSHATDSFYQAAVDKNKGRRIYFFKDVNEIEKWLTEDAGLRGADRMIKALPQELKQSDNLTMYVNKEGGNLGFAIDIAPYLCHKDNPFFDQQKAERHGYEVLINVDSMDGEFANYLVSEGLLQHISLPAEDKAIGKRLAQENLDFLCRNLRRGRYGVTED